MRQNICVLCMEYFDHSIFILMLQTQSDEELQDTRRAPEPEESEEKDAPEALPVTPKTQPEAAPKLKTPLQPTKVSEFEAKEEAQQAESAETNKTEVEMEESAKIEAVSEVEVKTEISEPDDIPEREKPQHPRYSQLSEEEERLRTYSEMSETSEDRIRFVIGETDSEAGSHLDLKGILCTIHSSVRTEWSCLICTLQAFFAHQSGVSRSTPGLMQVHFGV